MVGSTKLKEWLTVWLLIPKVGIIEYDLHSSDITVVRGITNCIIGNKVAADLFETSTMKKLLLPLSITPKTQCSSLYLPRLYILLPNFDASISTTFPTPPT